MSLVIWIVVFLISIALLIKAADWFTKGAEITGLKLKINPFIVGVTIVSIGTSLPELVTSVLSVIAGQPEIVTANAIGSNVANILLVVGMAAVVAGKLVVDRSLIDLDAPLLAISTAILLGIVYDQQVTTVEGVILLVTYGIYVAYTVKSAVEDGDVDRNEQKIKRDVKESIKKKKGAEHDEMSWYRVAVLIVAGAVGVFFGAHYVIQSVVAIGAIVGIAASAIAITAIAMGTSLPELVVSLTAAKKGNPAMALGNVFGSNIFNSLVVIGIPALFVTIPVDAVTFSVGLFFLVMATILFIFSGISKRFYKWDGYMMLVLYVLFILKIFTF